MQDLDFDELDKAVKAVMKEGGVTGSTSTPTSTSTSPQVASRANSVTLGSTGSSSAKPDVHKGPLVGGSKDSFKPKKRSGLFMDMKTTGGRSGRSSQPNQSVDPLMGASADDEQPTGKGIEEGNFESRTFEPIKDAEKPVSSTSAESTQPKEPFEDAFASLKSEVDALGVDVNPDPNAVPVNKAIKKPAPSPVSRSMNAESKETPTPEPKESDDESNSFSPFLSSVSIDKRPLGGYGEETSSPEPDASVLATESVETVGTKIDSPASASPDDFYGVDPLADMTIEDIDATIVDPEGVSSTPDKTPEAGADNKPEAVSGDLGSRIERELSGEGSDGEASEEVSHVGANTLQSKAEDEFHKEAPIFNEAEVVADIDAEFSEAEIEDPMDKYRNVTPAPSPVPGADLGLEKVEAVVDSEQTSKVDEDSSEESTELEVDEVDDLATRTIGPDSEVSVEEVAAMEESIAAQAEEPASNTGKTKRLGRKSKATADTKQAKGASAKTSSKSKSEPSILREGGPTSIQQQYRQTSGSSKDKDTATHGAFNPQAYSTPIGKNSKSKKGVSVLGVTVIALVAVAVGVGSAFGVFYSGII